MQYFSKPSSASNKSGMMKKGAMNKEASAKGAAGKQGILANGTTFHKGSRCASCFGR